MNWKHAYLRKATEEEKDFYNSADDLKNENKRGNN